MYLKSLELVGFKSFAERTTLQFAPMGITAIVGPNGSGKSCVVDAIRWGLAEQSLKSLRAKKTEDLLFVGSGKRSKTNFAEVSLTFDNHDQCAPVETPEFTISRRAGWDGVSEYLLGGSVTRLSDLQLMLASARANPSNTTIIAQGMVDQLIIASPTERKTILDEAAGIRPLEMKRHHAGLKLEATEERLHEAELLLAELEPRVRSLRRQVKRWERRDEIERELKENLIALYRGRWHELETARSAAHQTKELALKRLTERDQKVTAIQQQLAALEKNGGGVKTAELTTRLQQLEAERRYLTATITQAQQAVAKTTPQKTLTSREIADALRHFVERLRSLHVLDAIHELANELDALANRIIETPSAPASAPPNFSAITNKLQETDRILGELSKAREEERRELFTLQHALLEAQRAVDMARNELQSSELELARISTRRESLYEEAGRDLKTPADIHAIEKTDANGPPPDLRQIENLRSQLAAIGSVDEQLKKEYEETEARTTELEAQVNDLRTAIRSLRDLESELDAEIHDRFENAFHTFATEFEKAFKILFNGGSAKLQLIRVEVPTEEENDGSSFAPVIARERTTAAISGIDIKATPPGKKVGHLGMLSGGERTLTAIALMAALIATNPAPFIVLDEVDAALDEANTDRFAKIITSLSTHTQFIVVTHNRVTMEHAKMIYGVTMGADGASKLLSLKLEDA